MIRRNRLTRALLVCGLVTGALTVGQSPAHAAGYLRLNGNACAGGSVLTLIAVTDTESAGVNNGQVVVAAPNAWTVHLNKYTGDQWVNFAVKCSNNVWYYPTRRITGWASPRWLGWI